MANYQCEKCKKLFVKKYDYDNHLKRKFPCVKLFALPETKGGGVQKPKPLPICLTVTGVEKDEEDATNSLGVAWEEEEEKEAEEEEEPEEEEEEATNSLGGAWEEELITPQQKMCYVKPYESDSDEEEAPEISHKNGKLTFCGRIVRMTPYFEQYARNAPESKRVKFFKKCCEDGTIIDFIDERDKDFKIIRSLIRAEYC